MTPLPADAPALEGPTLDGKVAWVAGAGNGIGRAIAVACARAGAAVLVTDLDPAGLDATAGAVTAAVPAAQVLARRSDVTRAADSQADVAAARTSYGGLDVLVYCAAAHEPAGTVIELDEAGWELALRVNLTGAFLASKAALPALIARGGGSVVLLASQLGRVASPGRPAYCATKGALIQLARVMAADHAAQGIRVNTLSPGAVETGRLVRRFGDMAAARTALAGKHLLGRLGQPEEIARAALFLASAASSFMTGADLLVDGGYTTL